MEGFQWVQQSDFSGGAYPLQERVPRSGVEKCENGVYDEDGSVFKRGGGAYLSGVAPATIRSLFDVVLGGGQRSIALTDHSILQLAADDATFLTVLEGTPGDVTTFPTRVAVVGGMLAIPVSYLGQQVIVIFGGSRKGDGYFSTSAADVTVGANEREVTGGAGAAWLTDMDPGMMIGTATGRAVVQTIESDASLTLSTPWNGDPLAAAAQSFEAGPVLLYPGDGPVFDVSSAFRKYVASVAGRLLVGAANTVTFSKPLDPVLYNPTDFHVLPEGATLTGIEPLGTSVLLFTTRGVYRIDNLSYDLTDALGNVQQMLSVEGRDVVLWDDLGIAGVDGAVLVPALDGLYAISGTSMRQIDAAVGIKKLWRSYVAAGYVLGNAAVYRGHYHLPVLNGNALVDVLVMRLDTGAWSNWAGHSAGVSFAQRDATLTAPPKLLVAQGTRILNVSGAYEPGAGNKREADGSQHNLVFTPRTVRRRDGVPETLVKARVRYELDDAAADNPTLVAAVATGRPGSAFTNLSGAAAESDGERPKAWTKIHRRATEARIRLTSVGPSSKLVIRSVETAWRPSGKQ